MDGSARPRRVNGDPLVRLWGRPRGRSRWWRKITSSLGRYWPRNDLAGSPQTAEAL